MIKFPDSMHFGRESRGASAGHGAAFWVVTGVFVAGALLGADVIWMVLEEVVTILSEFVAERLEHFYQKTFGLDLYHAQMATAYSGALIVLSGGFFLLRKFAGVARYLRVDARIWWSERSIRWARGWRDWVSAVIAWWRTLDLLNKAAAVIALVVMVIPMALLLSYGFGMAVAEMF